MAQLTITYGDKRHNAGSIKLNAFSAKMKVNLVRALRDVGASFSKDIKRNLSGPSHTKFPGNGNPFPGVVSGTLRRSVTFHLIDNNWGVKIGPGGLAEPYAAVQEFGHPNWKRKEGRPYVRPVWEKSIDEAVRRINDSIMRPIR